MEYINKLKQQGLCIDTQLHKCLRRQIQFQFTAFVGYVGNSVHGKCCEYVDVLLAVVGRMWDMVGFELHSNTQEFQLRAERLI